MDKYIFESSTRWSSFTASRKYKLVYKDSFGDVLAYYGNRTYQKCSPTSSVPACSLSLSLSSREHNGHNSYATCSTRMSFLSCSEISRCDRTEKSGSEGSTGIAREDMAPPTYLKVGNPQLPAELAALQTLCAAS